MDFLLKLILIALTVNHSINKSFSDEIGSINNALFKYNEIYSILNSNKLNNHCFFEEKPYCLEFKKKLNSLSDVETILKTCIKTKESPQVIFFGETHFDEKTIKLYPKLITEAKNNAPEINCLFLEANPWHQHLLDEFLSCTNTDKDCYEEILKLNQSNLKNSLNSNKRSDNHLNQAYLEVMVTAKKLNLKVIAVDNQSNSMNEDRNITMAKRINSELSKNGQCKKAIMLIGNLHLITSYFEELPTRANNIPEQLKKFNINSTSINLSILNKFSREKIKIPGCSEEFTPPEKISGFVNFKIDSHIPYEPIPRSYEGIIKQSYWSDFCGAIFIP